MKIKKAPPQGWQGGPWRQMPPQGLFDSYGMEGPAQGFNFTPSFWVPFNDLGAGVVDTTEFRTNATPTYTGASAKWTRGSNGNWLSVASGSPRSYYDANLVYRGFMTEFQSRTNRCLQNRDLTQAGSWTASNITPAKDATGIDGVANSASTITATAGNGTILQAITNASVARSGSCWMKRKTGTGKIYITLDGDTTRTEVTSLISSSEWALVQMQQTLANPTIGIKIETSGDAVYVDMVQEETGASASCPIDTTVAAVTRAADVLTYPIGNVDNAVGTIYCEIQLFGTIGNDRVPLGGSGVATRITNYANLSIARVMDGTTTVSSAAGPAGLTHKLCYSWGGAGLKCVIDNGVVASGAFDGAMPFATALNVGGDSVAADSLMGAIRNLKIFNRQLSPSQMSALTA